MDQAMKRGCYNTGFVNGFGEEGFAMLYGHLALCLNRRGKQKEEEGW
jgi:hypothetical protein